MDTFQKFIEEVKEHLLDFMPEEYKNLRIKLNDIVKSNDSKHVALTISKPGSKVATNVYLEEFYDKYLKTRNRDEIMRQISDAFVEGGHVVDVSIQQEFFQYNTVKQQAFVTIMNREKNRQYTEGVFLKDIPGTDLSAVIRIMCNKHEDNTFLSFLVTQEHLNRWGVSGDSLYQDAIKNSSILLPEKMITFREQMKLSALAALSEGKDETVIEEMLSFMFTMDNDKSFGQENIFNDMYVLTNTENFYGAAAMLYPDILKRAAEYMQSNFFILPSSQHEVLLVKDTTSMEPEEFLNLVMEVNRTDSISPDEVLSDAVYYYDRSENKLSMAVEKEMVHSMAEQLGNYRKNPVVTEEYESETEIGDMEQ